MQALPASRQAPKADAGSKTSPSHEPANAVGSAQAANGAAPGQPTAPKPVTAAHLAALPRPLPESITQGIDVKARSKTILEHLSAIIRFFRDTVTPIQKVGEPSDVLYAEQAQSVATQVAQLAFQSARDEAALLARVQIMPGVTAEQPATGEAERLNQSKIRVAQRMQDLQSQLDALDQQIATAHPKDRAALQDKRTDLQGQLELVTAASEALAKVAGLSTSQVNSGLVGDIDKLQHSVPEIVDSKVKPVASSLQSLESMRDAGVSTQAQVLFQLISTEHTIEQREVELDRLHQQAVDLRTPLTKILHATLVEGQKLDAATQGTQAAATQNPQAAATQGTQAPAAKPQANSKPAVKAPAPAAAPTETPQSIRKKYDELTDAFKTISGVSVPISQEVLLLEQAKANLLSWHAAVDTERKTILHALLIRVIIIAVALLVVLGLGEAWRRGVARYVQDVRRRRQLLVIRRMVVGFLSGIILILGFVTQFSSLATFAGFITAGIAVGLQTVLLSVAAYFFIVGRYGVRVGDRITVANVTGEVVEVGLVRFYMMELAGAGTELHPTGRIAVFANSVLFQTGTPLYKQIPGTNYAWHEIAVKLKPGVDYEPALQAIRSAVEDVYNTYKPEIERQHAQTETWMDTTLPSPKVECRLQLADGLQYNVLYPVPVQRASATDQQIVQKLVDTIAKNQPAAQAMDGPPVLRAIVKS